MLTPRLRVPRDTRLRENNLKMSDGFIRVLGKPLGKHELTKNAEMGNSYDHVPAMRHARMDGTLQVPQISQVPRTARLRSECA